MSTENKLPECPYYVAHPQAVWFNEHWRPVIEQLKADARTAELNRQSLWVDSVKMADELNYLKAKTDIEIQQLKSKLKIAVEALQWYSDKNNLDLSQSVIMEDGAKAKHALREIGG